MFIAPKIDDRTSNVFYGCRHNPDMFGESVNVIPLTIKQFQEILTFFKENGFSPASIYSLLDKIDQSREEFQNLAADRGIAWVKNIQSIISDWKNSVTIKGLATS